jgi:hypothetical protein
LAGLSFSPFCIIVLQIRIITDRCFTNAIFRLLLVGLIFTREDMMELKEYFENTEGTGVLATADGDGKVDAAIYARPHFLADGTIAMIMRDRLTHFNLQSNPHACYLFVEKGPGYKGKRLFLTKFREEQDSEMLQSLRRRQYINERDESKFLVFFKLDKELPLIGAGKSA